MLIKKSSRYDLIFRGNLRLLQPLPAVFVLATI